MRGKKYTKDIYIEFIRGFAILLVIFNHTDGYFLYYSNTENPLTWCFSLIGSVICRSDVPLFIMITGALLLGKIEPIRDLYKKRIWRLGIILIIFSLFYYIINVFRNSNEEFSFMDFLKRLLNGSIQESFWYLYLYLGILLLLPLLRKMASACKNSELKYLLILQIVMETGVKVFSLLTGININDNIYILNVYVFYLMAGYYIEKRIEMRMVSKPWIIGSFVVNLLCLSGTFMFVQLDYCRAGRYDQEILNLFTPVLTVGIFIDIKWVCLKYDIPKKVKEIIYEAGGCVFGIYLLEQFARIQLLPLYLYLSENTFGILACSCYVLSSFMLAWLYTELLKCIPLFRRLL